MVLSMATLGFTPVFAEVPGFAFLQIPTGTRASALGGAFSTLGQGVEAAFWNPAGLDGVKGFQVAGGHYELFQDLRHDHFAVGWRMFGVGVSGSVRALYTAPIEERDELGNQIGTFGSHDLEFSLGAGGAVGAGLTAGASAQVVRERIANSSATTYSFGLGGAWQPERWPHARAALQISGLGPAARYHFDGGQGLNGEGEPIALPTAVQGGVSYRLGVTSTLELRTALEARAVRGRNAMGLLGLELGNAKGAALRAGWRTNDDASNLSMGAGYGIGRWVLDYAYVPLRSDLGDTHRFSFAAQF